MGAPNAGKSTLLNQLVGQKLAIISPKPQTTRSILRGIVMTGECQVIFVDTPGLFTPKETLEKAMVRAAWSGFDNADIVLLLVDASKANVEGRVQEILDRLKRMTAPCPVWLALNKTDACSAKEKMLPVIAALNEAYPFEQVFMISAKTGDGVSELLAAVAAKMPEGPYLYDPEEVTDAPQRLLAAEITREQLFLQLEQELPYSTTVETDSWESFEDGSAKVMQTIFVQRDGQKGIVIGHRGERLKAIGAAARKEMKEAFGFDVHLFLHIKVKENWQEKAEFYQSRGLTLKE
jgi:GTP-binding protein Era